MTHLGIARAVLARDLACDPSDLDHDGVRVVEWRDVPGRRRFSRGDRVLIVATMGTGAVVSCDRSRIEWALRELGQLDRNEMFMAPAIAAIGARVVLDGEVLLGPQLKFVCAAAQSAPAPERVSIELVDGTRVADLYADSRFRHALSYLTTSPRPDMLAALARVDGKIVGVAGASADCDEMWQIGVDVLPEHRGRGIGRSIVARATSAVLAEGRLPYYSTTVSNLGSARLALSLGYQLAWIEMYARG